MSSKDTDAELVRKTLAGDLKAFWDVVERYKNATYGTAYKIVRDFQQAQEIAHQAFIIAYEKLSTLREPEKFATWLRTISANEAKRWLRSRERIVPTDDAEILEGEYTPEDELEKKEVQEAVTRAINSLSEVNREAVILYHIDGLSYEEIGNYLSVSISTVKGRLYRARQQLKQEMVKMVTDVFDAHKLDDEFTRKVGNIIGNIRAQDGTPLKGASIRYTRPGEEESGDETQSDDKGKYCLSDLSEGLHVVRVYSEGYDDAQKIVSVTEGQVINDVDITLRPAVTISGTIYKADGVTRLANTEIYPTIVYYHDDGSSTSRSPLGGSETDAEGRYYELDVLTGKCRLIVSSGGVTVWKDLVIEPGEDVKADFVLHRLPVSIRGRVVEGEDKYPVAGFMVKASKFPDTFRAKTDADGVFEFRGLEDGRYVINYDGKPKGNIISVDVKNGVADRELKFLLTLCRSEISLKVFGPDGMPIEAAWVHFGDANKRGYPMNVRGYPNLADGILKKLKAGSYQLTVCAEGCKPTTNKVQLEPEQKVDLIFQLEPEGYGIVKSVVKMPDGKPAKNALIAYVKRRGGQYALTGKIYGTTSGEDGGFEIKIPEGDYAMIVAAAGLPKLIKTLEIQPEQTVDMSIQLLKGGVISGKLVIPAGQAYPKEAMVFARLKGGEELKRVRWSRHPNVTDEYSHKTFLSQKDGSFSFKGLLPGEYSLWIEGRDMPQIPKQTVDVKSDETTEVTFRVPGLGVIQGRVTDMLTGTPATDIKILVCPKLTGERDALTDSSGCFKVEHLTPGDYVLAVLKDGFPLPSAVSVTIAEGEAKSVDLKSFDRRDSASLGFIAAEKWFAIGTFDNPDNAGLDIPYPPETELMDTSKPLSQHLQATYAARGQKVGWKDAPESAMPTPFVDLTPTFPSDEPIVVYAVTTIESPKAKEAQLRFYISDECFNQKAWLNGELVYKRTKKRTFMEEDIAPVKLKQGQNWLLLKFALDSERLLFCLRVTDAE